GAICRSVHFFFQAEDGIRDFHVTGVQTCALPIFPYNRPVQLPVIAPSGGRKAEPLSQPPKSEAPVPVPEEEQKEREVVFVGEARSEERRVGKEGRAWR